jgi:DNA modification methylase
MNPWWVSDNGETQLQLSCGHVLEVLRELPAESVHCVITSPPYWGLRDYSLPPLVWGGDPTCGHEWGGEQLITMTPHHLDESVASVKGGGHKKATIEATTGACCQRCGAWRGSLGLEPMPDLYVQHLVAVFQEVRRVLRRDGTVWLNMGDAYVSAPMGNTKSRDQYHNGGRFEYSSSEKRVASYADGRQQMDKTRIPGLKSKDLLGLPWRVAFALQADGWYLRSDIIWAKPNPMPESVEDRPTKAHEYLFLLARSEQYYYDADAIREPSLGSNGPPPDSIGQRPPTYQPSPNGKVGKWNIAYDNPLGRNKRTVWEIATQPYPDAHFATFPEALVEPCILAGCPAGSVVLDPFCGSGTALLVAQRLGRHAIGIDLSLAYCALSRQRLEGVHAQQRLRIVPAPAVLNGHRDPEQLLLVETIPVGRPAHVPDLRLKQDALGKATYTGFNARWKAAYG